MLETVCAREWVEWDRELTPASHPANIKSCRTFEQASPYGIAVGSQADLSDLVIKSEKDDFAKEGGDDADE